VTGYSPLLLASLCLGDYGITAATVARDDTVTVTPETVLRPGQLAKIRSRVRTAARDHLVSLHEDHSLADDDWTLTRTPTGAWSLTHGDQCRLRHLGAA